MKKKNILTIKLQAHVWYKHLWILYIYDEHLLPPKKNCTGGK